MNYLIVLLFVLAVDLVSPVKSFAVTIEQPQANTAYYPGQKVHVVVKVAPEEDIVEMLIKTNRGTSEIVEQPPYEADLNLDKTYLGAEEIAVYSRLRNGSLLEARLNITVQLPPDVKLQKILVDNRISIIKAPTGSPAETRRLSVRGLFSDGVKRDIDATYTSSDPNIVTVVNNGTITAVSLGWASISIVSSDKNESVKVHVFIDIELSNELVVKPTDSGIELGWKLSPQDPEWVTGYQVFRTDDPDGIIKKKIAEVPNGVTTYVDTNAEKGKTYYYTVQAVSTPTKGKSNMTDLTPGMWP